MSEPILDRFSALPISRQRKYQLRHNARGLCAICPRAAIDGYHCAEHKSYNAVRLREVYHKVRTSSRRYLGAGSYQRFPAPFSAAEKALRAEYAALIDLVDLNLRLLFVTSREGAK